MFSVIYNFMQTVVLTLKENVKKLMCLLKIKDVEKIQKIKSNSNAKLKITIAFLSEKQQK